MSYLRFLNSLIAFTIVYLSANVAFGTGWSNSGGQELVTGLNASRGGGALYQQNSNLTAVAAAACFILAFLHSDKAHQKLFYIFLGISAAILTFYLGGRSGIMRVILAVFLLLLLIGKGRAIKLILFAMAVVFAFTLITVNAGFLIELGHQEGIPEGLRRLIVITLEQNLEGGGEARVQLFLSAIEIWASAPLAGVGLGGFATDNASTVIATYPHNAILEVLSEIGIIGLLLYLIFLLLHIKGVLPFLRARRENHIVISKFIIFVVVYSVAMFSADISNRASPFFFGLLAAGTLANFYKRSR